MVQLISFCWRRRWSFTLWSSSDSPSSARSSSVWVSVVERAKQVWCGLWTGHCDLLEKDSDTGRVFLACLNCERETPGWILPCERGHRA